MDVLEIRRRNLQMLITAAGSARALSDQIDRAPSLISRWRADKPIGEEIARHIETRLRLEHGWMDHPHWPNEVREEPAAYMIGATLTPDERALLDNYRASDPATRRVVGAAAAAGAKSKPAKKRAG